MHALVFCLIFSFQANPAMAVKRSRAEYEKTGRVIWDVQIEEKLVAITFDDGPHPTFTPQILDILEQYDAKATFFVAGNKVIRFPEVLKRVEQEGHEIANHTYNHIYSGKITSEKLTSELEQTDQIIESITGKKPTLYRPVGGLYNDVIIETALKNGKHIILWSWNLDPKDWRSPPAGQMVNYITKGVQPGNIILFHDWIGSEYSQTSQTVMALKGVLGYLHDNGYECVTVSELLYRSKKNMPELIDPFR